MRHSLSIMRNNRRSNMRHITHHLTTRHTRRTRLFVTNIPKRTRTSHRSRSLSQINSQKSPFRTLNMRTLRTSPIHVSRGILSIQMIVRRNTEHRAYLQHGLVRLGAYPMLDRNTLNNDGSINLTFPTPDRSKALNKARSRFGGSASGLIAGLSQALMSSTTVKFRTLGPGANATRDTKTRQEDTRTRGSRTYQSAKYQHRNSNPNNSNLQ